MADTLGELRVGASVKFKGDATNCRHVRIYGTLQGFAEGRYLSVGQNGIVEGDGNFDMVQIFGRLRGSLECTGKLIIRSTGKIGGDIIFNDIEIERGSWIEGRLQRATSFEMRMKKRALWINPTAETADSISGSSRNKPSNNLGAAVNNLQSEAKSENEKMSVYSEITPRSINSLSNESKKVTPRVVRLDPNASKSHAHPSLQSANDSVKSNERDSSFFKMASKLFDTPRGTLLRSFSSLSRGSDAKKSVGMMSTTSLEVEDALSTPPRIDRVQSLVKAKRVNHSARSLYSPQSLNSLSPARVTFDSNIISSPKHLFETPGFIPHEPNYQSPGPSDYLSQFRALSENEEDKEKDHEVSSAEECEATDEFTELTQVASASFKKKGKNIADFYGHESESDSEAEMIEPISIKYNILNKAGSSKSKFSFTNSFSAKNLGNAESALSESSRAELARQKVNDINEADSIRLNHLMNIMQSKRVGGALQKGGSLSRSIRRDA